MTSLDKKLKEFYLNVSEEDIYPIDADPVGRLQGSRMLLLLQKAAAKLTEKNMGRADLIETAIAAEPELIIALRSLIGEHETTFRLIISTALYKQGEICGCSDIPKIHTEKFIVGLAKRDANARKVITKYFFEQGLPTVFQTIIGLEKSKQVAFIRLIAQYQVKQRLAKLRGHRAEQIIAQFLEERKIPFEPREKLHTLGARDAVVSFLNQRECDLVIPNADSPRLVIQSSYYQSITGSIASKTVRETRETQNAVDRHNRKNPEQPVEFWLLIDGVGWLGMGSILRHIIDIPDNFFQFRTLETKLLPRLRELGF